MSRPHDWQFGFKFGVMGLVCKTCGQQCYAGDHDQYYAACPLTVAERDARIRYLVNLPTPAPEPQ